METGKNVTRNYTRSTSLTARFRRAYALILGQFLQKNRMIVGILENK